MLTFSGLEPKETAVHHERTGSSRGASGKEGFRAGGHRREERGRFVFMRPFTLVWPWGGALGGAWT